MRVLHIVDEPYDSGITHYALSAASGLAGRGHECRIWGLSDCYPVREAVRLGLPAQDYTHPWINLPSLRRSLADLEVELVVAHTGSAHSLAVALAAWRGRRIPVIRTRGDPRPLKPRPGRRFLWKRTSGFVAANDRILKEFRRLYRGLSAPGVRVYEGTPDPGAREPPLSGTPTVGIVSRLDPVKGHSVLLKAAKKVARRYPDVRLLVIGRQENVKSADLLSEAHRLGLDGRVELTGHVPDVYDYMRRCHIGVVASIGSEAISRAAVEWMAAGRPIVATRVGCLPEYVVQGRTGLLVPPRDADSMAEAIGSLVADVYLRERMGKDGRARYEEHFQIDRFLDETEKFYEKTLHAVPSR